MPDDHSKDKPRGFEAEERPTLIPCPACGGEFRRIVERARGQYATALCPHCKNGHMDDAQLQAWKTHRIARPIDS